ncbi:MAG TPA: glycosyltransferase 87 family protein, partial [Vicinamibacterales bacterium]|nr:glycosyltransferase 87 family protein [Vicinamibacterales bacterium]
TYLHGPTQYLTLYALSFLDSFDQIAAVLLPLYLGVLLFAFWLMWRSSRRLGADRSLLVPMVGSTFLFFPLLQAYLQREFEVVLTALFAGALLLALNDRRAAAAAVLAYAAFFKYIPLLFSGYLVLRRWWKAAAVFLLVSVAILLVSEWLFGLSKFFNNNVPGHAGQVFVLWGFGFATQQTGHLYGTGFCEGWTELESTLANLRHGLCTMAARGAWVNPPLVYLAICATVASVYLWTHVRLERMVPSLDVERRRRALEISIVTTICSCFFFAHYYYLIALLIPLNVLLTLYWIEQRRKALALWGVAYLLLGALVVPQGVLDRLTGVIFWEIYMWQNWYWYGEVLLVGLLLFEYARLTRPKAVNFPA